MINPPQRPSQSQMPPLEIPPELVVEYVNLVRISHSPSELVFDFAQLLPGSSPARVQSRIVMSPLGAKLFQRALAENLAKYESAFGEIVSARRQHAGRPFIPPAEPTGGQTLNGKHLWIDLMKSPIKSTRPLRRAQ